jgi:hypothetical protein
MKCLRTVTNNIQLATGVGWPPLDPAAKEQQVDLLTNTYVEAFRKLAPNIGCVHQ